MNGSRAVVAVLGVLLSVAAAVAASRPSTANAQDDKTELRCDFSCYGRYQSGGWHVYETKNFRFYHHGIREQSLVELARCCEQTRVSVRRDWLAIESDEGWSPKCDVCLYSNSQEYARCAGCSAENPGYTNLEIGFGKVWKRRLHLRIDRPGYLEKVVPHELTHVVLADRFHTQQIPCWADEGIAILAEPARRREELQRVLAAAQRSGSTLPLHELLTARSYPADRSRARLFYAQSAALVEYLVSRHSQTEVVRLVELAQQQGYDPAIREVLGSDGVAALEADWKVWLASADHTDTATSLTAAQLLPPENNRLAGRHYLAGSRFQLFP